MSNSINEGASIHVSGRVEDVSVDTGSAVTLICEQLLDKVDMGK